MVSESEFLSRYGPEGLTVEYKAALCGIPRDFWETYSSFANTEGGVVILGVSEDEFTKELSVTGIEDPAHYSKVLWDTLNNPAKVSVNLLNSNDVNVVDVDGKIVMTIHVPRADRREKPVYLNGNMDRETYKRNHGGDFRCKIGEIRSMLRDSFETDSDNEPLTEIPGYDCLVMEDVDEYLRILRQRNHSNSWINGPLDEVLITLGAVSKDSTGLHPTRAGLLMFGKVSCIIREFPDYRLDYREKLGDERWSYRLNSDDIGMNLNVYTFLRETRERLSMKIGSSFKLDGMIRDDDSDTLSAVREGLMNAIVHADYQGIGGVTVDYDGRVIRISNPGGLRIPLEKAINEHISDPRNKVLMRMCLSIGLVEEMGSGISEMFKAKDRGHILNLTIEETSDPLRVNTCITLPVRGVRPNSNASAVINYVMANPHATMSEISSSLNIPSRTLTRTVSDLIDAGVLVRSGSYKYTTWTVIG